MNCQYARLQDAPDPATPLGVKSGCNDPKMKISYLALLPRQPDEDDLQSIRSRVSASRIKVIVIDDDPTGTQTVHGIDVLADWSVELLREALTDPSPCFYILANTRSMPEREAAATVRQISSNLSQAGRSAGTDFTIISRGDSTLRGHFAAELEAIEAGLGIPFAAKIVIPAFFEGGRYTVGDVHYVADGESLIPISETEYATDRTFGYCHSNLAAWIEEKTDGAVTAGSVASLSIELLRGANGWKAVRTVLLGLPPGAFVIVNAAAYGDLEVFTRGLLEAEASGRRYLVRSAASYVRIRAAIETRPLLDPGEICDSDPGGGLVVVGSYVNRTTQQLEALLGVEGTLGIELAVDALGEPETRALEIVRAAGSATAAMREGKHAVVFTSRKQESAIGTAGDIATGRIVSEAIVEVVREISQKPRFLIAKGGITSSDIAVHSLGMRKARVLGQAAPGVPVWKMGTETRFPGMKFVVWPGNVGAPDALREFVRKL
jgi:uncharacterized protein YgbK (DUF1537 family)